MQNIDQAISEYEYILHALDEGVSVQEIREELYRMEHEGTITAPYNTLTERGEVHENQL
jgi:hypothetical protein